MVLKDRSRRCHDDELVGSEAGNAGICKDQQTLGEQHTLQDSKIVPLGAGIATVILHVLPPNLTDFPQS